jgi:hypothetical protein
MDTPGRILQGSSFALMAERWNKLNMLRVASYGLRVAR